MRCKVGDLAYIVAPAEFATGQLAGKFVDVGVLGRCQLRSFVAPGDPHAWMCRFHSPWYSQRDRMWVGQCLIFDSWLRPIRDQPGEDEALDWAPVSTNVTETCHG